MREGEETSEVVDKKIHSKLKILITLELQLH